MYTHGYKEWRGGGVCAHGYKEWRMQGRHLLVVGHRLTTKRSSKQRREQTKVTL